MSYIDDFIKRHGRKPTHEEEMHLLNQTKPFFQMRKAMEAEGTWRGVPSGDATPNNLNLPDDHPWKDRPTDLTRAALEIQRIVESNVPKSVFEDGDELFSGVSRGSLQFASTEGVALGMMTAKPKDRRNGKKKEDPESRRLTPGERHLAREVFGSAISYGSVRIFNKKWRRWQSNDYVMAPNGKIYYPPGNRAYGKDISRKGLRYRGLFVHEMTHVWQSQARGGVVLRGLVANMFGSRDYLPFKKGKSFKSYNIEQQANIVRDYYYLLEGVRSSSLPPIEDYEELLPFAKVKSRLAARRRRQGEHKQERESGERR